MRDFLFMRKITQKQGRSREINLFILAEIDFKIMF